MLTEAEKHDLNAKRRTQNAERIQTAERKARYGHRDWVYWTDRDGVLHIELLTTASCQMALMTMGGNTFTIIAKNTAHHHLTNREIGSNILKQLQRGIS